MPLTLAAWSRLLLPRSTSHPGCVTRPGPGWWAVAADDLPGRAAGLAGPVRMDGELPAELVQRDVMVPVAQLGQVGQDLVLQQVQHLPAPPSRSSLLRGVRRSQSEPWHLSQ
jgi:hypothetical protein